MDSVNNVISFLQSVFLSRPREMKVLNIVST